MAKASRPKLDRFGTLKAFLELIPDIKAHTVKGVAGGYAAALAYVAFWDAADARTGRAILTVSRLARVLATENRNTARRCITALHELGLITPHTDADGKVVKGRWIVKHLTKDESG